MKLLPESARTIQALLKIAKDEQELQEENIPESQSTSTYISYFANTVSTTLKPEENKSSDVSKQPPALRLTPPYESTTVYQQRPNFNKPQLLAPQTRQPPLQHHSFVFRSKPSTFRDTKKRIQFKNAADIGTSNVSKHQLHHCFICRRNNHRTSDCYYEKPHGRARTKVFVLVIFVIFVIFRV